MRSECFDVLVAVKIWQSWTRQLIRADLEFGTNCKSQCAVAPLHTVLTINRRPNFLWPPHDEWTHNVSAKFRRHQGWVEASSPAIAFPVAHIIVDPALGWTLFFREKFWVPSNASQPNQPELWLAFPISYNLRYILSCFTRLISPLGLLISTVTFAVGLSADVVNSKAWFSLKNGFLLVAAPVQWTQMSLTRVDRSPCYDALLVHTLLWPDFARGSDSGPATPSPGRHGISLLPNPAPADRHALFLSSLGSARIVSSHVL